MPVFKPYYTIKGSLLAGLINSGKPVPGNWRLNILLESENDLNPALFKFIGGINREFVFSITDTLLKRTREFPHLLGKLYLLTSMTRSLTGKRNILVFSEADGNPSVDTGAIKSFFEAQGSRDINFPLLQVKNPNKKDNSTWRLLTPGFRDSDSSTIIKEIALTGENTIIYFKEPVNDLSALEQIDRELNQSDKQLVQNEAGNGIKEREEFEMERDLWRKRALLYQDFLMLSKSVQQKEYYDVIDWYHKEYEALPVWYKRLGHVIKVLMGKRKLKSLFNKKPVKNTGNR